MFEKIYQKISSGFAKSVPSDHKNNLIKLVQNHQNKHNIPTYQTIACDLLSNKQQVFEAAVYELCVIAHMKPHYQKPIFEILSSCIAQYKNDLNRIQYIKNMLSYHHLDEFIHN